jgi:chromosome partitioning protein
MGITRSILERLRRFFGLLPARAPIPAEIAPDEPPVSLLAIPQIANLAGVSKEAVGNWRLRYDDFPRPVDNAAGGPVWEREPVEEWVQSHAGQRTHVLSFINLKGGVGKTTTAVAVAEMLAEEEGKHVLLIDLDPQTNATVTLIAEEQWADMDRAGRTIAQLFEDHLNPRKPARFDIEVAIAKSVSTVSGGIARLDLLASSIQLIDIQDRIPMVAMTGNFTTNPLDILRNALQPVIDRYDYVIIDCPPSLGTVTRNGLRISTGYVIPTIPDIVSTWGLYQIVDSVERFGQLIGHPIPALGIVATKVQQNNLHKRVLNDLRLARLGRFAEEGGLSQPPLFEHNIPQSVAVARGADVSAKMRTLRTKYGDAHDAFYGLTQEIKLICDKRNP